MPRAGHHAILRFLVITDQLKHFGELGLCAPTIAQVQIDLAQSHLCRSPFWPQLDRMLIRPVCLPKVALGQIGFPKMVVSERVVRP